MYFFGALWKGWGARRCCDCGSLCGVARGGGMLTRVRVSTRACCCCFCCLCTAGIIDYLQQYSAKKASESFFKSLVHSKQDISAVEPHLYAKRFTMWIDSHVM